MIFEKKAVKAYKSITFARNDESGGEYYFSPADFEGLRAEDYSFRSSAGNRLKGYLYSYDGYKEGRLVIFEHGFFGGHRSYMREIELLCRHGYLVLAYDHTGCMESEGEGANGMAQSLSDLNDCLAKVKQDGRFAGFAISVVGHSWGGFSTMNIPLLYPDLHSVVAISGFVSVEALHKTVLRGVLRLYRKAVFRVEREANPRFALFDGTKSLADSSVPTLLIYSDNDPICCKNPHFDLLHKALCHKENMHFLLVKGKGHNPNYTADAVAYLGEYSQKRNALSKKGLLKTRAQREEFAKGFDWVRMTEQDGDVWREIFALLDADA